MFKDILGFRRTHAQILKYPYQILNILILKTKNTEGGLLFQKKTCVKFKIALSLHYKPKRFGRLSGGLRQ
jgi:hypothetical protein